MVLITNVTSVFLAIVLSLFQICGGFPVADFVDKGLEKGLVQDATISLELGEDLKELLTASEQTDISEDAVLFSVDTKSYLSIKDGYVYSKGNLNTSEGEVLDFELGIDKNGVTIDKNTLKKVDEFCSLVNEQRPMFHYYDFEEENVFIPFARTAAEEFGEDLTNLQSTTPKMVEETLGGFLEDLKVADVIKVLENTKTVNVYDIKSDDKVSKVVSGSLLDYVYLTKEIATECFEDADGTMAGCYEHIIQKIEDDADLKVLLKTMSAGLTVSLKNDTVEFGFQLNFNIPTDLLNKSIADAEANGKVDESNQFAFNVAKALLAEFDKETVHICTLFYETSVSVNEQEVEYMTSAAKSFTAKDKKDILSIQSEDAYRFVTTEKYATKSFSCVYEKSGIDEDGYTEMYSSGISIKDETGYVFESFDLPGIKGYIIEERMYLPLRVICESTGHEVRWDDTEKKAYVSEKGKEEVYMEGVIINDKTYIKIRDFEKLGAVVDYQEYLDDSETACRIVVSFENTKA